MPPSKLSLISNEDFTRFISNSTTWPQVINKCGFFTTSCPKVKERAMAMKLNVSHIIEGRKKGPNKMKMISDSTFKELVSTSQNWNDVARKIGFKVTNTSGGAGMWCKARAIKMGLNIAHVRGLKPFSDLKHGRKGNTLKRKLKDAGIPEICSWCRCEHMQLDDGKWLWFGRELRLQVDHINGKSNPPCEKDDDVKNLRFLCYNCHSQTPNSNHRYIVNHSKKKRGRPNQLLSASAQEYICQMCQCEYMQKGLDGVWVWNGLRIKLQCDHIDGDRSNNEISNMRWLCPCCHSTTDTFCGRNKKRKRQQREQQGT